VTGADPDILARALLRERQGAGARYDAPTAPAADLLLARRGTAYFARQLNGLTDAELTGPSAIAGWARSRVVVGVAFQARWLARLAAAARLGLEVETIVEPELFLEDIELAATLPAQVGEGLVAGDAREPGADRHRAIEAREIAVGGEEHLLGEIVDVLTASGKAQQRAEDHVLMVVHDLLEGEIGVQAGLDNRLLRKFHSGE